MTFHTFVQLGWGVKGKKKKITKPWGWGLLSWWVLNSAWPRHAALLAARKEGNTKEKNVLFVFRASFCPFHLLPGQSQPTATSPSLTPEGLNPQTSQMEDLLLLKPFLHVCGGKKRDGKIATREALDIHSHLHSTVQKKMGLIIPLESTAASQVWFLCLPCESE